MTSFTEFHLDAKLLQAVEAAGFITPTKIQEESIPAILTGQDLMASAQTGTGKTAAFVLPILHRLLHTASSRGRGPRVLVLTPTRELAGQVNDDIRKFSKFTPFRAGSVVGGVGFGPQIRLLREPLDLLVATPGRLLDHMSEGRVDFSRLEVFVLDEADRMLDMGFIHDVRKIGDALPERRQTLLFSATLEGQVLNVARDLLRNPERIQLATNTKRHEDIQQRVFQADDADHKHRLLAHHLSEKSLTQAVIFMRTKKRADRLATRLTREGHACAALHGDMRQTARRRTVDQMKQGRFRVLVATDVAARGLDIRGISHVFNFDLPMVAEDYIHRIGRTGRAGSTGTAISFVGPEDWELLSGIQRITGGDMPREIIPGLEPILQEPVRTVSSHGKSGSGGSRSRRFARFRQGGRRGAMGRKTESKPARHSRRFAAPR